MGRLSFALAGTVLAAGVASGQTIGFDSPGGDTGASSFIWQGLEFTLDDQPGSAVNAAHRVEGDSSGELSILLKDPGKVSYKATIALSTSLPTQFDLGFRYGEDLSAPTPAFSDMTGFFRRISGGTEIVQQMLAGSDAANPTSVFYGTTGRTAAGGSMMNQAFLTDLGFGVDGNFSMLVDPDGTADTSVTAAGVSGSADFSVDLTPGGTPDPFTFNEIILQVESFQDATSFEGQFGETGQRFTFTGLSIETVPTPGAAALLGLGGLAAARRRRG